MFATEDVKEIFERVDLHDGHGGASVFHDQTSKRGLISKVCSCKMANINEYRVESHDQIEQVESSWKENIICFKHYPSMHLWPGKDKMDYAQFVLAMKAAVVLAWKSFKFQRKHRGNFFQIWSASLSSMKPDSIPSIHSSSLGYLALGSGDANETRGGGLWGESENRPANFEYIIASRMNNDIGFAYWRYTK